MTRPPDIAGPPRAHLRQPTQWPFGELAVDVPAARYAQRLAANLHHALNGGSYRSLERTSGVTHCTIAAVANGTTWPDLVTIAKLEWAIGHPLWPGAELLAAEPRRPRWKRLLRWRRQ